ncbi:MAG: zinc ABC transporter substrate-binding protein [Oligoflexales bacterium]|nr:zinc ABC transporter substrate-binding protein [Oligoflexales bacterium]
MASTENLKTVVKEIGGAHVEVESYCKGNQDPHYLEAKPSFMIKTHQADLVIAMGLELEVAWLPKVLSGGRNLKVMKGKKGYLEVGPLLDVLEVHTGHITRADGDVHPDGNPHVDLDPIRIGQIGKHVAARLALLDSKNKGVYEANAQKLMERMEAKTKVWAKRIAATGTKKIVTYHKTLTYFIDRFGLQSAAILEPLPGVPPTAAHILDVIKVAKQAGVKLTLVENIYDDSVAKRVAKELPGMRVVKVPISVGGRQDILKLDDVFEALVVAFEGDSK